MLVFKAQSLKLFNVLAGLTPRSTEVVGIKFKHIHSLAHIHRHKTLLSRSLVLRVHCVTKLRFSCEPTKQSTNTQPFRVCPTKNPAHSGLIHCSKPTAGPASHRVYIDIDICFLTRLLLSADKFPHTIALEIRFTPWAILTCVWPVRGAYHYMYWTNIVLKAYFRFGCIEMYLRTAHNRWSPMCYASARAKCMSRCSKWEHTSSVASEYVNKPIRM